MNKNIGSERYSVQNRIIKYVQEPHSEFSGPQGRKILVKLGWKYVNQEEAIRLREGETGFLFRKIFIHQIHKLNPKFMNESLASDIIKSIERIPSTLEGNLTVWEYLKGLRTVFIQDEKRERNVRLIDTDNINNNTFHATDEFTFTNGTKTIRPDIVFLINGFPVFFVETKASHKLEGMTEALEQVKRYHRECPELLSMLQVFSITHILKYFYSATWNTSSKLIFNWKDELEGNFETLVKTFFDRERVVKIISDYILFTRQDDELKKVVLRPHQMSAINELIERATSEVKKRGLIWHTQGSGKTFTMIVTAQKIIENPEFKNPTVIMLVDRNELESQLFGNLSAVGIEEVEVADSKRNLRKLLSTDKRGLIVSMIHKFDEMPKDINKRENIFVLVDEAHRTTGGKLGNYLMGALPNATYMGFTGTPIDKTSYGKGTFIVFGKDDPPHGYLHKYSISESIEDGATVPLHYCLAPNRMLVDKDTLEREFLDLKEAEGMSDVEELNKMLEKAVNLRNMLKNKERVEQVTKYVVKHFKENVEPLGYKAFLVAVDREACAKYKEELDKHLSRDYSEVVYSAGHNDSEKLAKYHLNKTDEKKVRKAFRKPESLPKILIVTEKLLTGFDAPILYCMYLDKPMRDHVLLQAIARVNRPYEDKNEQKKPGGLIVDFVGIFGNLEKALAFDSKDIEGVVHDIETLKDRFKEMMGKARKEYLKILEGKGWDKAVEAVVENLKDEEKRHEYYQFYKELSDIYDILSPDAFLRPYIDDFETLSRIYRILKEAYDPGIRIDREFSKKIAELVQEHTKTGKIKPTLEVYKIDENTIRRIEESQASDTEKVFNLLKSIRKLIEEEAEQSPYLISIGEKAETIAKMYEEGQKRTQGILEELKELIEEINTARKEQEKKNMSADVFTVYWLLKNKEYKEPEDKAKQMQEVFDKYPSWKWSESQEREVRQKLYKILIKSREQDAKALADWAKNILKVLRG